MFVELPKKFNTFTHFMVICLQRMEYVHENGDYHYVSLCRDFTVQSTKYVQGRNCVGWGICIILEAYVFSIGDKKIGK